MLNRYLSLWKLSHPQPLAETTTSYIYIVRSEKIEVVLKLLKPIGVKDESNGAIALQHFGGHGAVRLLRQDERAHLLEYADGDDLTVLVKQGQDDQATAIIGDVLNQLHAASNPLPSELRPLNSWFHDLFRKADEDRRGVSQSIYMRAAHIAEGLLADSTASQDVRVLHGDIHHANIRHHAQRGWLAFDPKGIVGERTYDAANTLCNPIDMPELVHNEVRLLRTAGILAQKMDIDLCRVLSFGFAYACLSASWTFYDGGDPAHALQVAALIEPHLCRP